jgi:chromosome segregation ATPase
MSDKDLGEITDNIENEMENLKNTKMKIFGITVTPTSIMGALTLVGALLGTLYGAFESYKAFQEMSEKLDAMDIEAVEARNVAIETKLADAIDYTRDIKNGLRDDILRIEEQVNRMEDKVEASEDRVKDSQDAIETHLETIRDEMNDVRKDVAQSTREIESLMRETEKDVRDTMRSTEDRIDSDMRQLDKDLNEKLQEALDNPLNDM